MKITVEVHREDWKPTPMHLGNLVHYSWAQGTRHRYVVIETFDELIGPIERAGCVNKTLKEVFNKNLNSLIKQYEL
nr:hypothetical protein [Nanoarchaeum sp.]